MSRDRTKRLRAKSQMPEKICAACGKPFAWRKKWERDWDNVRFCSERCRRAGHTNVQSKQSP